MRIISPINSPIKTILGRAHLSAEFGPNEPGAAPLILAGSVHFHAGDTVPTGFLLCNGATYLITQYPALFAAIGYNYGSTSEADFKVPNYAGEFLRFFDFGTGVDPDGASRTDRGDFTGGNVVGARQLGQIESHAHPISSGSFFQADGPWPVQANTNLGPHGTTTVGGVETRPVNINLMTVIKF